MPELRLALVGYGHVGKAFHRILTDRREALAAKDIHLRLVGIARQDRYVVGEDLAIDSLPAWRPGNVFEMFGEAPADILLEASPTDLASGQPALGHILGALREGMDVVMANKGPLVVGLDDLVARADAAGKRLRYEAAVGGCIPVLGPVRGHFAGDHITKVEGILNGTTNFILSRMAEENADLDQALREAQQLGYAETDPSADLDGLDAAAKVVILANTIFGRGISLDDVEVEGIRSITRQAVELAAAHGHRIRLVAEVSADVARVGPRLVPVGSPLDVAGALNAVRFTTDLTGQVTHIGAGAGGQETAAAMLADVLDLVR